MYDKLKYTWTLNHREWLNKINKAWSHWGSKYKKLNEEEWILQNFLVLALHYPHHTSNTTHYFLCDSSVVINKDSGQKYWKPHGKTIVNKIPPSRGQLDHTVILTIVLWKKEEQTFPVPLWYHKCLWPYSSIYTYINGSSMHTLRQHY